MKTEEKNKLIDTFLNNKYYENFYSYAEMKYHNDWNWLMDCMEKIEKLNCIVKFTTSHTISLKWMSYTITIQENEAKAILKREYIVNYKSNYSEGETKIEAVYNACATFIEWYNKNFELQSTL